MQSKLNGTASKLKGAGTKMSAAFTAPIVGLGAVAFAAADDMEKAYNNIRAGTGATGDELEELQDSFRDVFKDVPQSADEVSNVMADVNTATGATGDTLKELTTATLDAARAYDINADTLTGNAMEALNRWNIEAEDGVLAMDKLAVVAEDTGTDMDKLAGLISQHKGTLEGYGMSFEESAVFMGEMEKAGFDVNGVVREMRSSMERLAEDGKDPAEAFETLSKEMMEAETQAEATAIAQEVFGSRSADVAGAVRDGTFDIEEMAAGLDDAGGTIEEVGEDTMTMGDKFSQLKNTAQEGLEPLGEILMELAEQAIPPLMDGIELLVEWFRDLSPTAQKLIVVIGGIVAAVGPLLVMLGMMIPAITAVIGIIAKVGAAIMLLANPITWIVAAVAGIVALIIVYWDEIWEVTKTVFTAIGEFFVEVWDQFVELFTTSLEWIKEIWNTAWTWVKETTVTVFNAIADFFSMIWETYVTIITTYIEIVQTVISTVWNFIKDTTETVWNAISNFFSNIWESISNTFTTVTSAISNIISTVWNTISSVTSSVWNAISGAISAIISGISSTISSVFSGIQSVISTIWNTISSITSSIWNGITSTISGIINGISSTVSSVFNTISDTISGVWDTVSNKTSEIWDGIVDAIKGAINGVIGAINGMLNAIGDISIDLPSMPDWVPGDIGGGSISFPSIPNIPSLDVGTNFVAQDGLAMLHAGEAVVPKEYNPAAGGSGDGIKVGNIIIDAKNVKEFNDVVEIVKNFKQTVRKG
ncbi:phage tail tape measure protein [Virgibacillus natechei]|nr:phage tail tape measure protein [Virgibacillus natechei]UZD13090.1 phage tail tape measure protein [Virgibacillus natechei]